MMINMMINMMGAGRGSWARAAIAALLPLDNPPVRALCLSCMCGGWPSNGGLAMGR